MNTTMFLKDPLAAYASTTTFPPNRVGEISDDRSAIIGHNGWCYIYEGSNNYRGAYHDKDLALLGDQWARLIEERQQACQALGVKFVQLIVPNKATLMPENFPESLNDGITTVLQSLLEVAPAAHLLCPVEKMRQPGLREVVFRRNDSHLTVAGNAVLAELLLDSLGISLANIPNIEISKTRHTGDLGCKFREPISEVFFAPRFDIGLLDRTKIEMTHEEVVEGFNGTRQSFTNSLAPIKQTLLIFGNSFFEKTPSWGVSPLFASTFKNLYFAWTPMFDIDLINKVRPDIVISQTCERFMNKLPEHL